MAVEKEEEEEMAQKKVAVLTVLKNNSILKNIFLVDKPPTSSCFTTTNIHQEEEEETLVVGRHPDCNISLEHPSISRFHLRILIRSQSLSLIDLSSVHGTWVSGKKIEPGARVELKEGDTLRLGASSRIYRLHWVPLCHAYDLENPFVPPMDESELIDEREEGTHQSQVREDNALGLDSLFSDMNVILSSQEMDPSARPFCSEADINGTHQTQTLEDDAQGLDLLFSHTNVISSPEEESGPSASSMNGDVNSSFCGKEGIGKPTPLWGGLEQGETSELLLSIQPAKGNSSPQTPSAAEESNTVNLPGTPESLPMCSVQRSALSIWSRRGKPASVQIQANRGNKKGTRPSADSEFMLEDHGKYVTESISENLFCCPIEDHEGREKEKEEIFTPDKENCIPSTLILRSLKKFGHENTENESILKSSVSTEDEIGDETFTPNKENVTPNTLLFKSMKKMGKLEEINSFNPCRSSPLKNIVGSNLPPEGSVLVNLGRENETQEVLLEKYTSPTSNNQARYVLQPTATKGKADRVPFQSLPVEPTSSTNTKAPAMNESAGSKKSRDLLPCKPFHKLPLREENRRWTMVVDTASLVNKESRKALQLLQGLKGTNLIIPRIVVRELDCMNRRSSFFNRTSDVSLALQWIEDCMVNTKWWIHVQSSAEEVRPTALTPPATPLSHFTDDNSMFSAGAVSFSPSRSLLEIISPTAQDHILECALFFRRISKGHLVLLSDDVSTKIKAMAEGFLCETAEQFRESLVNPFSERFLWTDSSPRGPTWCCADDIVLREKYYHGPLKKPSKSEGVKGLKLILLHNSLYKQKTSVSPMNWPQTQSLVNS